MALITDVDQRDIVTNLIRTANPEPTYIWECTIWAGTEKLTIPKVQARTNRRTFDSNFGDELTITVMIGLGDYNHVIFPNRDKLLVELERVSVDTISSDTNASSKATVYKYEGILIDSESDVIAGRGLSYLRDTANDADHKSVAIQLTDPILTDVRSRELLGAIYRDVTVKEVIQLLLGPDTGALGVDIVEPDNQKRYKHIVIPPGIRVINLVDFLQFESGYGIYKSGASCYLHNSVWHVYPVYDTTQYTKTDRTLTIANMQNNRFLGMETTFRQKGYQLYIITTGDVNHVDNSETLQLELGNGVRYINADNLMRGFAKVSFNKAVSDRKSTMVEYAITKRTDAKNIAFLSGDVATSNHYREASRLARRNGQIIQVSWEHSKAFAINPGMPVKYLFNKSGIVVALEGVVLRTDAMSISENSGYTSKGHKTTTEITIFVARTSKA